MEKVALSHQNLNDLLWIEYLRCGLPNSTLLRVHYRPGRDHFGKFGPRAKVKRARNPKFQFFGHDVMFAFTVLKKIPGFFGKAFAIHQAN
jgi:hypothetical protein